MVLSLIATLPCQLVINVMSLVIHFVTTVHNILISEVPPPPVDIGSSDVKQTEAVITWSHPELYEMYAISAYSLQFKKFGTTKWTQFTTTRGENHRLTNLEHGTAYLVRLKSENEFGRGLPSENLELLTKKSRFLCFIRCLHFVLGRHAV